MKTIAQLKAIYRKDKKEFRIYIAPNGQNALVKFYQRKSNASWRLLNVFSVFDTKNFMIQLVKEGYSALWL